ncbi:M12 family metallo-peptidase [Nocardioides sp. GY 10127]|uniref:M12 family metallo-peptidase n=1 Tax=Nocardioides sp. GY 10127 TaxID=2569762 RepID=UPI0010A87BD5|nr:M12 family metallo-peptidase [Nocardioides sp. GY 10127]TIC78937.1 hypothetical protein E8D37_18860 [Nocardioides sp. GY 10127]
MTARLPALVAALAGAGLVGAGLVGLPASADDTGSTPAAGSADGGSDLYTPLPAWTPSDRTQDTLSLPDDASDYAAARVDLDALADALPAAAGTGTGTAGGTTRVDLPTPDGGTATFVVTPTRVLQARLAARHPELRTYAGHAVGDASTTVSLDLTPLGLHAAVRDAGGSSEGDEAAQETAQSWLVDPVTVSRGESRVVAYAADTLSDGTPLEESVDQSVLSRTLTVGSGTESAAELTGAGTSGTSSRTTSSKPGTTRDPLAGRQVARRTYRLALVNDPSYRKAVGGSANVLAAKTTLVNRVNQVYNDDLAIRLVLVNGTAKLNLGSKARATGANGPCGAHACFDKAGEDADGSFHSAMLATCGVETLGRMRTVLGQLIGAGSYDVGHLVLGRDGGGLAYLGTVGRDYSSGGCTGLPDPTGDVFAIDYVAHELGHQFAATHTFNGTQSNCSGANRVSAASVEPGSGSSVMGYAGICAADDLQSHTDPYFSQRSQTQVRRYTASDQDDVVEVQTVSLSGFDPNTDTLTITGTAVAGADAGETTSATVTHYTRAGLRSAVEQVLGRTVLVAQWGYDAYAAGGTGLAALGTPDETGFQVIVAGSRDPEAKGSHPAVDPLEVTSTGTATAAVGETAQGGTPGQHGAVHKVDNSRPVVSVPARTTIPVRTPFVLHGTATDADGDPLTFLWEENDRGSTAGRPLVQNHAGTSSWWGPLFRVFGTASNVTAPHTSPATGENTATHSSTRWFPDLQQVLDGNTNAATGRCKVGWSYWPTATQRACFSEYLPTASWRGSYGSGLRVMHLRLTARDADPDGGGTSWAQTTLKVDPDAGPFLVTSQADGKAHTAGSRMVVTWKVAHTRRLAHHVRIRLSRDGGQTWTTVLARTPNDGRAVVRLPGRRSADTRVMVRALGNYFYAVNDTSFRVRAS